MAKNEGYTTKRGLVFKDLNNGDFHDFLTDL